MTFHGICLEFDVTAAAENHAKSMYDVGHDMSPIKLSKPIVNEIKELKERSLKNWDTLRFVIGYNKSGTISIFTACGIFKFWHGC